MTPAAESNRVIGKNLINLKLVEAIELIEVEPKKWNMKFTLASGMKVTNIYTDLEKLIADYDKIKNIIKDYLEHESF